MAERAGGHSQQHCRQPSNYVKEKVVLCQELKKVRSHPPKELISTSQSSAFQPGSGVFEITPKAVFRHTSRLKAFGHDYPTPFFHATQARDMFCLPILILLFFHFGVRQASSGSAQQHYKKGVELLEKQQLDAAIAELSLSTRMNPGFADAQQCARNARPEKVRSRQPNNHSVEQSRLIRVFIQPSLDSAPCSREW